MLASSLMMKRRCHADASALEVHEIMTIGGLLSFRKPGWPVMNWGYVLH